MVNKVWQWIKGFIDKSTPEQVPEVDFSKLPIIERCHVLYMSLDLMPFINYKLTDGQGKSIAVAHETIDACISDISQHIRYLETTRHIPQDRGEYYRIIKPINRFFLTKDGCYLPSVHNRLVDLKTVVLDLFSAVEKTKDTDYYSYNLRMLNSLLFVLHDFGFMLAELGQSINYRS